MKRFERSENAVSVRIEKVKKTFGHFTALNGVDISIQSGEFFTLLGPSGCGKTTLLRCIAGFEKTSEGRILFNDEDTTSIPPWEKNIGFVFQNYALWPNNSVYGNVAYGLKIRKMERERIKEKVEWALELVGLPGIGSKMPEELSGGQQQRIAIARALVIDPKILLLDEPLSNLDAKLRISLRAQIREIQKKLGITAVYVTHDQEEALEISDRIAVMKDGAVLQIGSPEDIYERPADKFVADFVGKANMLSGKAENGFFVCSPRLRVPYAGSGAKTLMFRPEALTEAHAATEAQVEGTMTASVYHGNIQRYLVDVGCDTPLVYETRKGHAAGDTVRLIIESYRLYE